MPVSPFDATAQRLAVITAHTLVALDADVLTELQPEDFLLVQLCTRAGSSERLQEQDKHGNLVLDVHFNQKLTYAITAEVLEFDGLANYHPGRALDDRLLAFANGRSAFQFTQTGKLIYLDPRHTIRPGDLPTAEFTVEHIFIDLDETSYPSTAVATYQDIPVQTAGGILETGCTALLTDVFLAGSECTGALTGTLYNGNPATTGTPLGSTTSAAWTTTSDTSGNEALSLDSSPQIIWTGASTVRHITHIRFSRPGIPVADIALTDPLDLPAWTSLRADAADLLAKLRWPWDGTGTPTRPGRFGLRHLLGDTTTGLGNTSSVLTLKCWDADPATTGTVLDSFTVPRDATAWQVTGATLENLAITGSNNAPGGGWNITHITAELAGVATWLIKLAVSGSLIIPAGDPVTIPAGAITLALT